MNQFISTLLNLGPSDYERARKLNGVLPQTVYRWRTGKSKPRAEDLLDNPVLAEALAADARARAEQTAEHVAA